MPVKVALYDEVCGGLKQKGGIKNGSSCNEAIT